jgi:cyclase
MIMKRLVGVITVRRGIAVQSFGYARWLPLGDPAVLAANLDRWGADEILVQVIDRGDGGPDLALLDRLSCTGLSTPLIYGGGIRGAEDAVAVVNRGADRVTVDQLLHDAPGAIAEIAAALGAQAVIAALPLAISRAGLSWRDYRSGKDKPLAPAVIDLFAAGQVSEALLADWRHEGVPGGFDEALVGAFPLADVPLILFGGLGEPGQTSRLLAEPRVVAVAVGNMFAWREHAVQELKAALPGARLRPARFAGGPA